MKTHPSLVAGRWKKTGKTFDVVNPFTGKAFARVSQAGAADVENAIQGAVKGFEETRKLSSGERATALAFVRDNVKKNRKDFAKTIALEAGKPITTALGEVDRCVETFTVAAEEAKRVGGEFLPVDVAPAFKNKIAITRLYPIGPVSAITPFNFPLNLVAHKLAPAMAAGCSLVLKPASKTPLSALKLAELVVASGYPKEALSVLPIGRENADKLVTDERFKLLSFTGSDVVGWDMKARAGKKKVALELGGNAGLIVHDDADLEKAAEKAVKGAYSYAGQSCISVQRILVQERVCNKFKQLFLKHAKKLRVGDPLKASTDVGPMIDAKNAERIMEWIADAKKAGAKVVLGGKRKGGLVWPTVLEDVPRANKCYGDEAFAPIVTFGPYKRFEDALAELNGSRFGLQAGVFTDDVTRVFQAFNELEVGGVCINEVPTFRVDSQPYGGVKDSGVGREGPKYAIEDMTETRVLIIELGKRFAKE